MNDVFVGQARADEEHARALAAEWSAHGGSVGWDRDIPPGASFALTIFG